jgi:hypothetical protein
MHNLTAEFLYRASQSLSVRFSNVLFKTQLRGACEKVGERRGHAGLSHNAMDQALDARKA